MVFIRGTFRWKRETMIVCCCSILFFAIYFVVDPSAVLYQYSVEQSKRLLESVSISRSTLNSEAMKKRIHDKVMGIKLLCWVCTHNASHWRAMYVKWTWGRRCDLLLFISDTANETLPTIVLNVRKGRDHLWDKTKKAFSYVYEHHLHDYEWFMKADDDTYVIVENLKYMLSIYNFSFPIFFGSRFRKFSKQGYMSGGGGYVLSREALRIFIEVALPNATLCKEDPTGAEDAEMGKCLNNSRVLGGDSRDEKGRGRFFPFNPSEHLTPNSIYKGHWYWDYIYYPIQNGPECCSDSAITFHYIHPHKMLELEYFLYRMHPFGVDTAPAFPPQLPPDQKSIPLPVLKKYNVSILKRMETWLE